MKEILAKRDEGKYFIPGQVGLDDLQPQFGDKWNEDHDHPWHELEDDALERTTYPPDFNLTAREFLENIKGVEWDEQHRPSKFTKRERALLWELVVDRLEFEHGEDFDGKEEFVKELKDLKDKIGEPKP